MKQNQIAEIELVLSELRGDMSVPKNVRLKVDRVIEILKKQSDATIKVSKALNELEEIADDVNLESYTRTQIWNAISILEKMQKN